VVIPVRAINPRLQAANYARLYALRAAMWHVDAVLPHVEAATPADLQVSLTGCKASDETDSAAPQVQCWARLQQAVAGSSCGLCAETRAVVLTMLATEESVLHT
jgi:hypothetical protein